MAKKRTSGLYKRKGTWHIDKQLFGERLCESTGTASLAEAELYLAKRIEEIRQVKIFGVRIPHTFDEAAKKYVEMNKHKVSIQSDIRELTRLHTYFAGQPLESIHMGSLQRFIEARKQAGVKHRTINYALQVIRHLLNQAASEWLDEHDKTWLAQVPKIKLLPQHDSRKPRPLSWEEQERFFPKLTPVLRDMALFAVNTGCREQEICQLRWEWEIAVLEYQTSVFVIPGWYHNNGQLRRYVKNGEDKLVVLNAVAKRVIERQRGRDPHFVFVHRHKGVYRPYASMNTNGWQAARIRAGVPDVRVHDLRHTFGRRLRAASVGYEDRQDLLGHKSSRITTHYSSAEIKNLIDAVNLLDGNRISTPTLTLVKSGAMVGSRKSPEREMQRTQSKNREVLSG